MNRASNDSLRLFLLLTAVILFTVAALTNTFHAFVRPVPASPAGPWPWGGLMFGWAMALFAASFYF